MEFLIRAVQILHSDSPLHKSTKDILISNGRIEKIADRIDFVGQVISADNLKCSIGWFDMRAHYYDPGLEYKEDIESGANTALAGGFTDVAILPNTNPVVSSKNAVSYYQKFNRLSQLNLHPIAALTLGCEGKELTEMIDLNHAGAVAFSDGLKPVWHTDILLKSLQYLQKFNGLLINKAEDLHLTSFAHMHEGEVSTLMGVKGMPSLSESLMIQRDLKLLEYSGGRLHFSLVSCADSVELIRTAKSKGLNVTCDVGVNYLKYTDDALHDYDTNLKVNPPYRLESDRQALIEGVKDGTIDVIVSDHNPHDEESKKLEFDLADFGSSNQQAFYSLASDIFSDELDNHIECFTKKPRSILNLEVPDIAEGSDACMTLFTPNGKWSFDKINNKSKSVASPLFNKNLNGSVVGVINKGQLHLNNYED